MVRWAIDNHILKNDSNRSDDPRGDKVTLAFCSHLASSWIELSPLHAKPDAVPSIITKSQDLKRDGAYASDAISETVDKHKGRATSGGCKESQDLLKGGTITDDYLP